MTSTIPHGGSPGDGQGEPDDVLSLTGMTEAEWTGANEGAPPGKARPVSRVPLHALPSPANQPYRPRFVPEGEKPAPGRETTDEERNGLRWLLEWLPATQALVKEGTPMREALAATTGTKTHDWLALLAEACAPQAPAARSRTLIDLPYGPPSPQLVPPFLGQDPDSHTVLFGPGGVGKGVLSSYFALRLVRQKKRVMVIDYEGHPREWANRARALGLTDAELRMIEYRAPFSDEWTAKRGSLNEVADVLRAQCDDLAIDYVIIDSYVPATSTGDSMGGAPAAQEYYQGLATIGRPSLTIAHVAGGGTRFPDKPFGSVFVHNLARETWAVEALDAEDQEPWDPNVAQHLPQVVALELRNKKMNVGAKPCPQFITFSFFPDGHVEYDTQLPAGHNPRDLAFDILYRSEKPLSLKEIASAIKAESDETIKEATIKKALQRDVTRVTSTNDVPRKWTLKVPR